MRQKPEIVFSCSSRFIVRERKEEGTKFKALEVLETVAKKRFRFFWAELEKSFSFLVGAGIVWRYKRVEGKPPKCKR
jgi:hypothetical protein